MAAREDTAFGYKMRRTDAGWAWTTFDTAGRLIEQGHAPSKTVAAACVIRALARNACEEPVEIRTAA
jgi:hypothetical protein